MTFVSARTTPLQRTQPRVRAPTATPARWRLRQGAPAGTARAAAVRSRAADLAGRSPARRTPGRTAGAAQLHSGARHRRSAGTACCGCCRVVGPCGPGAAGRRRPSGAHRPAVLVEVSDVDASSSVEVDTMTQSRASANAVSARRRSSTDSEECDTNVSVPRSRSASASGLTVNASAHVSAGHRSLIAGVLTCGCARQLPLVLHRRSRHGQAAARPPQRCTGPDRRVKVRPAADHQP